jgi:hypothetical protein
MKQQKCRVCSKKSPHGKHTALDVLEMVMKCAKECSALTDGHFEICVSHYYAAKEYLKWVKP